MAEDFAADDEADAFSDAGVARIVLELDRAITRRRRAGAASHIVEERPVPQPVKPTRIELAVLTALAQIYGSAVINYPDFTPVLDNIAECGAVVLVQRALWGARPDDVRLAARLLDARIPFEILCGTWPEVFLAQARAELREFRPKPPKSPLASDGEQGCDD
ncbi:hypothetical protein [Caballeronia arationis]|uniref:hypothetical protein n=1 Tax=Caballeronia arationis TaxID=1777142 RepID=UPI0007890EAD|nr:hypothetical protein [Caballeronia arationis]